MQRVVPAAALMLIGAILVAPTQAARVFSDGAQGKPDVKSISVLGFAPEGVLLIGDGQGGQIFAVETGDTKEQGTLAETIQDFDKKLAAKLGTGPKGIEIIDLAVNPASKTIYVAVRKQDDKTYAILTVDGSGTIGDFVLDDVKYARIKLDAGDSKISTITDVAWADDRVIAAARSSEEFASKIFSILAPFKTEANGEVYTAETYHVSHGRWETKAPMSVLIPYKEDGKTFVVGAFSCTPIVKYPIDSLQPGAKVQGQSVLELGSGNRPIDMFVYEKDGKPYVLANTFRFHHERRPFGPSPYWTVKFEQNVLAAEEDINEEALRRLTKDYKPSTDKVQLVESFHGTVQMDKLDDSRAVALQQTPGGYDLVPLALP